MKKVKDPTKRHIILWYRPRRDKPGEWRISPTGLKLLVGFFIVVVLAVILGSVTYTSMLRRALESDRLAADNERMRQELLRVDQMAEELRELQNFAQNLRRSLTEGDDIQRILQARQEVHREIPRDILEPAWVPVEGRDVSRDTEVTAPITASLEFGQGQMNLPQRWPVEGFITRGFHYSSVDPIHSHTGLDIAVPRGTPIRAVADGVVLTADWSARLGHRVILDHGGGVFSVYGHNEMLLVLPQQVVRAGTPIALSGNSGISTAPHLHFEMWVNGRAIDPNALLPNLGADDGREQAG